MLMSLRSLRARLWTRDLCDRAPAPRPKAPRLGVERLDDRIVPAINVVPTSQAGVHLRDAQVVNAGPGTTIVLAPGDYTGADYIHPSNSGTSGAPITYQAANAAYRADGTLNTTTDSNIRDSNGLTAVVLNGKDFIRVEGITIGGVEKPGIGQGAWGGTKTGGQAHLQHWVQATNGANNNVFVNNNFRNSNGNGINLMSSSNNTFDHNYARVAGTYDTGYRTGGNPVDNNNVSDLFEADRNSNNNTVKNNNWAQGGHNVFWFEGDGNTITGNKFNNDWTAVYTDNNGAAGVGYRVGALSPGDGGTTTDTRGHNVFSGNTVSGTRPTLAALPPDAHDSPPAMKVEGVGNDVFNNIFVDNFGDVIQSTSSARSYVVKGNDIHDNTFDNNGGRTWVVQQEGLNNVSLIQNNKFRNNTITNSPNQVTIEFEGTLTQGNTNTVISGNTGIKSVKG